MFISRLRSSRATLAVGALALLAAVPLFAGRVSAVQAAPALTKPTGLHVVARSSDTLTLGWNAVPGVFHYRVMRDGQRVAFDLPSSQLQFTDDSGDLLHSAPLSTSSYTYQVCAGDGMGNPICSDDFQVNREPLVLLPVSICVTNPSACQIFLLAQPSKPSGLHVISRTLHSVTIGWDAFPGTFHYRVMRDGQRVAHDLPNTQLQFTDDAGDELGQAPNPGQAYTYQVCAGNGMGDPVCSDDLIVSPFVIVGNAPQSPVCVNDPSICQLQRDPGDGQ